MNEDRPRLDLSMNSSMANRDALIVEDNIIIAMAAEDILGEIGFARCIIAASNSEAMRALEDQDIAFAMLDINLGEETSEPIAVLLQERGIPFVFATGYGESPFDPDKFREIPTLTKPYSERDLKAAIKALSSI